MVIVKKYEGRRSVLNKIIAKGYKDRSSVLHKDIANDYKDRPVTFIVTDFKGRTYTRL